MATSYPQVVLLGDSLIEQSVIVQDGFSFHSALQAHFLRRYDVVNRGLSGYNTANVLKYMATLFPEPGPLSPKIDYLVVLLGANDATIPLETVTQHVPIHQYKENLLKIISHPHVAAHRPTVLLVTPPPLDEIKCTGLDVAQGHASACRTADVTAKYAETAREVARESQGVILVDLWQAVMAKAVEMTPGGYPSGGPLLGSLQSGKQGGLDVLLPDGLHMAGQAYRVFYDQLLPHLGDERDAQDKSGYQLPEWSVLNPARGSSLRDN